jgi:hypothetical protein
VYEWTLCLPQQLVPEQCLLRGRLDPMLPGHHAESQRLVRASGLDLLPVGSRRQLLLIQFAEVLPGDIEESEGHLHQE